jgi:uncharacterized membrane protein YedE/YeeE
MKSFATALVAGLLFGSGLLLSGMANPQNVLGFLDVAGTWNPALAFTMAGAIVVAAPAYHWVRRHGRTVDREPVDITPRSNVDAPLLTGAAVFGIGWGMSGICPGPALILLAGAASAAPVFVGAMVAGMLLVRWLR